MGETYYNPPEGVLSTTTQNINTIKTSAVLVGSNTNINANGLTTFMPLASIEPLNEIAISLTPTEIILPSGIYELNVQVNLLSVSNARQNFFIGIHEGGTLVEEVYQPLYMRRASGHDRVGSNTFFKVTTSGGNLSFSTRREANSGTVRLINGKIALRKIEQISVVTGVTLS
jgi:hypothetical protein